MDIKFTGNRALITGAGRGIGRALALSLHRGGAETYALSRTQATLDSLAQEAPGIHIVCADVSKWKETRTAIEGILREGAIDLLVNNAGVLSFGEVGEITEEAARSMCDTNFLGAVNIGQEIAKGMIAAGKGGSIVNISSSLALAPKFEGTTIYSATKAALDSVTRSMALELGKHRIRVNSVNPALTLTEMGRGATEDPVFKAKVLAKIPFEKFVEVRDVVNATLYLLSDQSDMISGIALPVDGGQATT